MKPWEFKSKRMIVCIYIHIIPDNAKQKEVAVSFGRQSTLHIKEHYQV